MTYDEAQALLDAGDIRVAQMPVGYGRKLWPVQYHGLMALDWLLMKDLVETVRFVQEVYDERTGERFAAMVRVVADNHSRTAARALRDASRRTGEARRQQLQLALGPLRGAFTAQSWIAGDDIRAVRQRKRHSMASLDEIDTACQTALMIAAVYASLGNDDQSVREWIRQCLDLVECWDKLHESIPRLVRNAPVLFDSTPGTAMANIGLRHQLEPACNSVLREHGEAVRKEQEQHCALVLSVIESLQDDGEPEAIWISRT